jgi:hypothetical protein
MDKTEFIGYIIIIFCIIMIIGLIPNTFEQRKIDLLVKEDYMNQISLNATMKEKLEVINYSCEKEIPEDLKLFGIITLYTPRDCVYSFINRMIPNN